MKLTPFKPHEQTMRRRLVGYMLVLIAVILLTCMSALSLMGRFHNDKTDLKDTITLQLDFWEKNLLRNSDNLAAMGIDLSEALSNEMQEALLMQRITFDELRYDQDAQVELQSTLLPVLKDYLLRSDASGAYIMLDVSANSNATTRPGLYLQRKSMTPTDNALLLYRGKASVGKNYGIMPHRKWRLELGIEQFVDTNDKISYDNFSNEWSYCYTDIFTLPGTSEQAILLEVPIRNKEGRFLGICGFEISQTYFKYLAQPANYPRLCFLLTSYDSKETLSADKLVAGTTDNYFINPVGAMTISKTGDFLQKFSTDQHSFVGLQRSIALNEQGDPYAIAVMLPQEEYNHLVKESFTQTLLLLMVMLIFAITCCVFFSKIYLLPILQGLEELKARKNIEDSSVMEINDLLYFLLSQDQAHENALQALEDEKNSEKNRAMRIQAEYEKVKQDYETSKADWLDIGELQDAEIKSSEYDTFKRGLKELTITERKIVQYYFEGKTVKDIQNLMDIKESTLRYHNRNIYGKLGVHSMKQLLQFAVYANEQKNKE